MRRLLLTAASLLATLTLLLLTTTSARAHGDLVDGSPGPGDVVAVGTDLLRLEFTDLDPDSRPYLAVRGPSGDPVAVGRAVFGERGSVCARSAPLQAGVTTIDYSVLSEDGDRQQGSYTFEVAADGEEALPGACDAAALDAPGEAQTLEEMSSGGVPDALLYGLGAAAVLAAGLLAWRIRADRRAGPDVTDDLQQE